MTSQEAIKYIHSLMRFGSRPGLNSITRLMNALDNPQQKLKFIHVAGTNGKGSTCAFCSNILKSAGLKVGTYISPFVVSFNERIQINGEYISDDDLAKYTEIVKLAVDTINDEQNPITEFEFITALGFCYFADKGCDVVVLEVGLGGRLDATNVIKTPLVSVITKIDLDHTGVLGGTEEEIAYEKSGIIKYKCPVVTTYENSSSALEVISKQASENCSNLKVTSQQNLYIKKADIFGSIFEYKDTEYEIKLAGRHQISNAVMAITAVNMAFPKINEKCIKEGLVNTTFPARCEVISKEPLVILDGSHNPNGTSALNDLLENSNVNNATAIIGFMADKDVSKAIKKVSDRFSNIIAVDVKSNARSMKAEDLKNLCLSLKISAKTAENYTSAITEAIGLCKPIIVFGSLYLAGDIRPILLSHNFTKNN